jgi:ADP-ribose pyrophosphatase
VSSRRPVGGGEAAALGRAGAEGDRVAGAVAGAEAGNVSGVEAGNVSGVEAGTVAPGRTAESRPPGGEAGADAPGDGGRPTAALAEASPPAWERLSFRHGEPIILFRPRYDAMRHPRTGDVLTRLVLETRDWVNVVARTADGRYVLVRQYRFGTGTVTTEIPGGVVDPGETPRGAAERELREETGYTTDRWSPLGSVEPNPAFHDNRCHHFLAEDVRLTHPQALDGGEDIAVLTVTGAELVDLVRGGAIAHSLVIAALARVLDLRSDGDRAPQSALGDG